MRALKKKIVGFDELTIYKLYVKKQNKVIRVKNLQIFGDTSKKIHLALPDFDKKPLFNRIQLSNTKKNVSLSKLGISKDEIKIKRWTGRSQKSPIKCQKPTPPLSKPKHTQVGQSIKPTAKVATSLSKLDEKKMLIILLAKLLGKD